MHPLIQLIFYRVMKENAANIHGHRWKLEVTVQSETLEQTGQIRGMVVDFGQLKDDIKKISR
mgnify:CR=1 FL=1